MPHVIICACHGNQADETEYVANSEAALTPSSEVFRRVLSEPVGTMHGMNTTHFHRWGCVGHLAALEAAPSRPLAFRGGRMSGPCGRPPLLLRREGLLRAAARLILPLEEVALAAVPVLGAPEEHPAQIHRPQGDDLRPTIPQRTSARI